MDETKIEKIKGVDEFTVCPKCGYTDGFHSVFTDLQNAGPVRWILICPQCSARYDIGLRYNSAAE